MREEITAQIIDINRQFYQSFGTEFSRTRRRVQPGVRKIVERIGRDDSLLDVGCGNGEFIRQLAANGHRAPILGVDFSLPLLEDAKLIPEDFPATFHAFDITEKEWTEVSGQYSVITCFAMLHHIPSEATRLQILRNIHQRLAQQGQFIHSNWQFLNSERLRKRIQGWDIVGLDAADVDEGDYLLDWRSGGTGYRYAHHYSEAELAYLAEMSGFKVVETFYSDGAAGDLGLYQVWEKNSVAG
ncbi:MAG: class I SAM-dependent methyltransferase [Anaerolineae bacterium]|nr:class I SAM-dependent methyltransferase [Anaerolineae bacterium]